MSDTGARGAAGFLAACLFIVALMLLVPLILLLRFSLDRDDPAALLRAMLKLANYRHFAADPFYRSVLLTTLAIAAEISAVCLILGTPVAYRLARMGGRPKTACMLALLLPLVAGEALRAIGWLTLFAHGGMPDSGPGMLGGRAIHLLFTPLATLAGIAAVNLPCVILVLQRTMETIDPGLEEAARTLGAPPGRAFRRVVWPLARGGILRAGLLSFVLATDAYATPILLGGPHFRMMSPLLQYWQAAAASDWPFTSALALLLMAVTLALTALGQVMVSRSG